MRTHYENIKPEAVEELKTLIEENEEYKNIVTMNYVGLSTIGDLWIEYKPGNPKTAVSFEECVLNVINRYM